MIMDDRTESHLIATRYKYLYEQRSYGTQHDT